MWKILQRILTHKKTDLPDIFLSISLLNKILGIAFLIPFLIQLFYYLLLFVRAREKSTPLSSDKQKFPPISVIICAKNEADNLRTKLPLFLEQDYPEYELIVVNDGSDDETNEVLENLKLKYPHLKISSIAKSSKFLRGKKLALTIGLKAAINEIVLLTDADCEPASKDWIKLILRNYEYGKSIVIGVGLYKKTQGLLNTIIRFESAFIAMQYISLTRIGRPYMGVGRNLSYRKELFFNNNGFASHLKLESGDDDLFISDVANSDNCIAETNPNSFTYSEPEKNWSDWINQKKRHLSTAGMYKKSTRRILVAEYLSRMILTPVFIYLLFVWEDKILISSLYSFLLVLKAVIFYLVFKSLKEKFLFLPSIIIEPFMPWVYGLMHISNFIDRKRTRWN